MAGRQILRSEPWRFAAAAATALGLWMLLDLAAGWAVGTAIGDYPRFAATEGFRWVLAMGLGLLAIAFVVAVARLAGRPVAYLLASVLLGINLFQAVASIAWRLGSAFSSVDDVLGLTQYSGEAVALAIAMVIVYWTPGLREDQGRVRR